ncbi:hypothetical protein, partial [Acinetobacter nosocomialis]|uniref:hypothetical protein n=1 Tax=Acinetobacter nosocomialis TaxID=106654 RepID=UPI0012502554
QTSQQVEAGDWASKALPKPHEIRAALDQYVIGQDLAKKTLSVNFAAYKQSASAPEAYDFCAKSIRRTSACWIIGICGELGSR